MALSFCNSKATPHLQGVGVKFRGNRGVESVKNLIKKVGIPPLVSSPPESLRRGTWVKLICGASFEDVVDIRNLSLVYTLAGEFDPEDCPLDCSRPCELVCPANAISIEEEQSDAQVSYGGSVPHKLKGGVITERCYGCGRCFPVCPYDRIRAATYVRDASTTSRLLKRNDVDAVEIHTNGRQTARFEELWDSLGDSMGYLKLVAVSLPYNGDSTLSLMNALYTVMEPRLSLFNLWQLDGRPMSGDIGRGATRESIAFAVCLATARNRPPGFLQLAGGTNAHTVNGLKREGLFRMYSGENSKDKTMVPGLPNSPHALISGIAYGGYARKIVGRVLNSMHSKHGPALIEHHPEYLLEALVEALALVRTVKGYDQFTSK
ncbi:uncharacterized protein LOC120015376 isoform X2 [Tripterygium wilfordii]|uniref:uncharacterized protein LOC120015376 isoform X2 n=1 Tax=Tripterygium wilfordii TaxID=458696 RepID=UPI0018F816CA|nr:uncharacterized protein LOC120015376 isoform X2 [Tripterygium wilfordii]